MSDCLLHHVTIVKKFLTQGSEIAMGYIPYGGTTSYTCADYCFISVWMNSWGGSWVKKNGITIATGKQSGFNFSCRKGDYIEFYQDATDYSHEYRVYAAIES